MWTGKFSEVCKITQVITPTAGAAGQTAINGTSVDMADFEGVIFLITFGAITAGAATSVNAATSSDNTTFNDLTGTGQTVADSDDGDTFYIDITNPIERYLRCEIARATQDSVVANALAIQYRSKKRVVSHASTINGEAHDRPAEGTA